MFLKRTPCGVTTNSLNAAIRQDCYPVLNRAERLLGSARNDTHENAPQRLFVRMEELMFARTFGARQILYFCSLTSRLVRLLR